MTISVDWDVKHQTKHTNLNMFNSLSPGQFCMKMQMGLWIAIIRSLVIENALLHHQEQPFCQGEGSGDGLGGKWGRRGWKWGNKEREVLIWHPLSTPSVLN